MNHKTTSYDSVLITKLNSSTNTHSLKSPVRAHYNINNFNNTSTWNKFSPTIKKKKIQLRLSELKKLYSSYCKGSTSMDTCAPASGITSSFDIDPNYKKYTPKHISGKTPPMEKSLSNELLQKKKSALEIKRNIIEQNIAKSISEKKRLENEKKDIEKMRHIKRKVHNIIKYDPLVICSVFEKNNKNYNGKLLNHLSSEYYAQARIQSQTKFRFHKNHLGVAHDPLAMAIDLDDIKKFMIPPNKLFINKLTEEEIEMIARDPTYYVRKPKYIQQVNFLSPKSLASRLNEEEKYHMNKSCSRIFPKSSNQLGRSLSQQAEKCEKAVQQVIKKNILFQHPRKISHGLKNLSFSSGSSTMIFSPKNFRKIKLIKHETRDSLYQNNLMRLEKEEKMVEKKKKIKSEAEKEYQVIHTYNTQIIKNLKDIQDEGNQLQVQVDNNKIEEEDSKYND